MVLPQSTVVVWKPQLKLPFMTNLGEGYGSGYSLGIPIRCMHKSLDVKTFYTYHFFVVIFDDLGLTSELNNFMDYPFLESLFGKRRRREIRNLPIPGVNYAFGDR